MFLNEYQKHHLLTRFKHIDRLMADTEQILSSTPSRGIFQHHVVDVTPAGLEEFERGASEFRESMKRVLQRHGLRLQQSQVSILKGALTNLTLVDIALEELKSKYMRGYGELTQESAERLDEQILRMQTAVAHIRERMVQH
ncbi:MAG: hypothetical protein ACK2UP_06820 [Candidatus Promineifilaceae bacterium]